jgi:N-acetylneuraminate synthase
MSDKTPEVRIGDRLVGPGHPVYFIAEIGINHNGDMQIAKQLIDVAVLAKCDAVKFQKRTPEICVPMDQRNKERETPWGTMTYMAYRERVEFSADDYAEIDRYCKEKGIHWFASPWDIPSVDFLEAFDPVCYKIPSACVTDLELIKAAAQTGRPVILSTGMSTMEQIHAAVDQTDVDNLIITHCTSAYPCRHGEVNLRMMATLRKEFPRSPIGYSGHEIGVQVSVAAAALGATVIERHITVDRAMWGSDQAASLEPPGLMRLVRDIRVVEEAMGDGVKKIYDSEKPLIARLRRI